MLIFHLKKKWFDLIKEGTKTHEYRVYNKYWKTRINNFLKKRDVFIGFMCGYKPTTEDYLLKAVVKTINIKDGKDTDLQYDGLVFDIEFKTELMIEFERKQKEALEIFSIQQMFERYKPNIKIIKEGNYKGVNYIIKKVDSWYCAYIITDKRIEIEESLAGQEITYSEDIKDCNFVKDKSLGKYVIGWDYAHSYNIGTPIDSIIEDIKEVIKAVGRL